MQARAFWVTRPGIGEIREETVAPPGPHQTTVHTLYSGISRGTETLVFTGRVPESEYAVMRCPFQVGQFPGPVKYGYSTVGTLDDGTAVFCLHPHQDRFTIPADFVLPLPEGVPPARAVLAANMETALNALWDSAIAPGDRVAVVGLGVVGLLIAYLAGRMPGVDLVGIDLNGAREPVARALGIAFSDHAPGGYDADIVINASGTARGLETALTLAGVETTVLEASWHGSTPVSLPLGEAFHSRRLTLRSTQVGMVAASHRPRWTHARRLAKALSLLTDPALDALIDGESPFTSLPETMAALADGSLPALCHRIRYEA